MKASDAIDFAPWTCPECGTEFAETAGDTGCVFGGVSATCLACGYEAVDDDYVKIYATIKKVCGQYLQFKEIELKMPKIPLSAEAMDVLSVYPQFRRKRTWLTFDLFDFAWLYRNRMFDRNVVPVGVFPFKALRYFIGAGVKFPLFIAAAQAVKGGPQQDDAFIEELQQHGDSTAFPELVWCEKIFSAGTKSKWKKLVGGGRSVERLTAITNCLFRLIYAYKGRFPERITSAFNNFSDESKFLFGCFVSRDLLSHSGINFGSIGENVQLSLLDAAKCDELRRVIMYHLPIELVMSRLLLGSRGISLSAFPFERLSDGECLKVYACDRIEEFDLPQDLVARAEMLLESLPMVELINAVQNKVKLLKLESVRLRLPASFIAKLVIENRVPDSIPVPYQRFGETEWRQMCVAKNLYWSSEAKLKFADAVISEEISACTLGELVSINPSIAEYIPTSKIKPDTLSILLIASNSDCLWKCEALKYLSAQHWQSIIVCRVRMIPKKYLGALLSVSDMTTDVATKIIDVDTRYVNYLPYDLIPRSRIVDILVEGNRELWIKYPFEKLQLEDWLSLIGRTDGPLPDLGEKVLWDEYRQIPDSKINQLVACRHDIVRFVQPERINPELALKLIIEGHDEHLWRNYDFRRFNKEQISNIIVSTPYKFGWPTYVHKYFVTSGESFSDDEIVEMAGGNAENVVSLLPRSRIEDFSLDKLSKLLIICKKRSGAMSAIMNKLTSPSGWAHLSDRVIECFLIEAPEMRKVVDWQNLPFKSIEKLQTANHIYSDEYGFPECSWYFIWKHWKGLLVAFGLGILVILMLQALIAEQDRAGSERRRSNTISSQVRQFEKLPSYEELNRVYLNNLTSD